MPTRGQPLRGPWVFRVPAFYPRSLNAELGRHWAGAHAYRRELADLLGVHALTQGVPLTSYAYRPVRRVRLSVVGWADGSTMPDPDNLLKFFLDAMTACRLVVDDAADWCDWERPHLQRGSPAESVVELADLKDMPACEPEEDPYTRRKLAAWKRSVNRAAKKAQGPAPVGGGPVALSPAAQEVPPPVGLPRRRGVVSGPRTLSAGRVVAVVPPPLREGPGER